MRTMKQLGKKGRFGNQLFQYAFLRMTAKDYQCPTWVGQALFGHDDPPVTFDFHKVKEQQVYDYENSHLIGQDNIDITGYFQYHTRWIADRNYWRSLFQPVPSVCRAVSDTIEKLRAKGRTIVGLHLRRGDYGTFKRKSARWCFVAPTGWYIQWLNDNMFRLDNPVLFIASDEPDKVVQDFFQYDVVVSDTSFEPDYYEDFYTLTQCDVMLISNSSFGFAASMLNTKATEFYRPRLSEKRLIPYDPWNAYPTLHDERY